MSNKLPAVACGLVVGLLAVAAVYVPAGWAAPPTVRALTVSPPAVT